MGRRTSRIGGTFAVAALAVGLLAFPAGVAAQTNAPIAQTGGMSATLPLLGAPLTVGVTLDTVGNISGVTLSPTGVVTQTSSDPSVVKFANSAGTTKVTIRAMGSKMSISAKSTKLADLEGPGTWSANVFGTGAASVGYTIGHDGSGHPTLALGTPSVPAGVTATVIAPKTWTHGNSSSASGGVTFAAGGFVKRLTISVGVGKDGAAHLKIVLSGKDRQKLSDTLANLVAAGNRTWSAYLCDGTTQVTVTYAVMADGTVQYVSSTPATPATTVKNFGNGFWAWFNGTPVGMRASLHKNPDGTTYTLVVHGSSGFCAKGGKFGFGDHEFAGWHWVSHGPGSKELGDPHFTSGHFGRPGNSKGRA